MSKELMPEEQSTVDQNSTVDTISGVNFIDSDSLFGDEYTISQAERGSTVELLLADKRRYHSMVLQPFGSLLLRNTALRNLYCHYGILAGKLRIGMSNLKSDLVLRADGFSAMKLWQTVVENYCNKINAAKISFNESWVPTYGAVDPILWRNKLLFMIYGTVRRMQPGALRDLYQKEPLPANLGLLLPDAEKSVIATCACAIITYLNAFARNTSGETSLNLHSFLRAYFAGQGSLSSLSEMEAVSSTCSFILTQNLVSHTMSRLRGEGLLDATLTDEEALDNVAFMIEATIRDFFLYCNVFQPGIGNTLIDGGVADNSIDFSNLVGGIIDYFTTKIGDDKSMVKWAWRQASGYKADSDWQKVLSSAMSNIHDQLFSQLERDFFSKVAAPAAKAVNEWYAIDKELHQINIDSEASIRNAYDRVQDQLTALHQLSLICCNVNSKISIGDLVEATLHHDDFVGSGAHLLYVVSTSERALTRDEWLKKFVASKTSDEVAVGFALNDATKVAQLHFSRHEGSSYNNPFAGFRANIRSDVSFPLCVISNNGEIDLNTALTSDLTLSRISNTYGLIARDIYTRLMYIAVSDNQVIQNIQVGADPRLIQHFRSMNLEKDNGLANLYRMSTACYYDLAIRRLSDAYAMYIVWASIYEQIKTLSKLGANCELVGDRNTVKMKDLVTFLSDWVDELAILCGEQYTHCDDLLNLHEVIRGVDDLQANISVNDIVISAIQCVCKGSRYDLLRSIVLSHRAAMSKLLNSEALSRDLTLSHMSFSLASKAFDIVKQNQPVSLELSHPIPSDHDSQIVFDDIIANSVFYQGSLCFNLLATPAWLYQPDAAIKTNEVLMRRHRNISGGNRDVRALSILNKYIASRWVSKNTSILSLDAMHDLKLTSNSVSYGPGLIELFKIATAQSRVSKVSNPLYVATVHKVSSREEVDPVCDQLGIFAGYGVTALGAVTVWEFLDEMKLDDNCPFINRYADKATLLEACYPDVHRGESEQNSHLVPLSDLMFVKEQYVSNDFIGGVFGVTLNSDSFVAGLVDDQIVVDNRIDDMTYVRTDGRQLTRSDLYATLYVTVGIKVNDPSAVYPATIKDMLYNISKL